MVRARRRTASFFDQVEAYLAGGGDPSPGFGPGSGLEEDGWDGFGEEDDPEEEYGDEEDPEDEREYGNLYGEDTRPEDPYGGGYRRDGRGGNESGDGGDSKDSGRPEDRQ